MLTRNTRRETEVIVSREGYHRRNKVNISPSLENLNEPKTPH